MELCVPQHWHRIEVEQLKAIHGGDSTRFYRNIKGLFIALPSINRGLRAIGYPIHRLQRVIGSAYAAALIKFGSVAAYVAGIVGAATVATSFYCLWNFKMFY